MRIQPGDPVTVREGQEKSNVTDAEDNFDLEPGRIYEVESVNNSGIRLRGLAKTYCTNRFEKLHDADAVAYGYKAKDDKVYLEGLIKRANDGRKALEELFRVIPEQMEVKCDDQENCGRKAGSWGSLKTIKRLVYRVKPTHKSFPIHAIGNWTIQTKRDDAEINEWEIKIGCQTFDAKLLRSCLQDMSNNFNTSKYGIDAVYHIFDACRLGVAYRRTDKDASHLLTWEEAEKLFNALTEYLR